MKYKIQIRWILVMVIAILGQRNAVAQDIHFSQIFETPLLRNPAFAGLFSGDIRVQSVFRSQWNSVTDAYKTGSANVEFKLPFGQNDDFITVGGQFLYDKAGSTALTATHILPVVNYHKSLGANKSSYVSLAFMGGWVQRSIDRSKITTNSQYGGGGFNPGAGTGENFTKASYGYLDGTVGLSLNMQLGNNIDNNLYAGFAYHHFNKAKQVSFYSDPNLEMVPKMVTSVGIRTNVSDYSFITLEGDYSTQGAYKNTTVGFLYAHKLDEMEDPQYLIQAGAYMRVNDALIPVIKIEPKPLAITLSYDINISTLRQVSRGRGGFELSLTYQKFLDRFSSTKDATKCPKF